VRAAVMVGGALMLGALCGRLAISHYARQAIELLVAVPVLIGIARRPMLAWTCLLVVLATVFSTSYLPTANLPTHIPINLGDALLLAAIGGTAWRHPWRTWPPPLRRAVLWLFAFLAFASVSSIRIAFASRNGLHWAIYGYKNVLYLLVAALITLELSGKYWRPALNVATCVAAVVSIVSIVAAASPSVSHLLNHYSTVAATSASVSFAAGGQAVATSAARIRLPGLYFAYAMLLPTAVLALMLKDRWRLFRIATFVLILIAVGLSLNRNMYGGAIAGVLVTILLGGRRLRHRSLVVLGTVVAVVVLLVLASFQSGLTEEVATRASTALSPTQVINSSSAQSRGTEFSEAFASIGHHPFDGVGFFQLYNNPNGLLFVENLPLDFATDYGVPAALAYCLIFGSLLAYGIRAAQLARRPLNRGLVAASVGSLAAMLISAQVGTYGQEPTSTTALGAVCGFLIVASLRARADVDWDTPGETP
jgi:hypothetical protein